MKQTDPYARYRIRRLSHAEPDPSLGEFPDCRATGYFQDNREEFLDLAIRFGEQLRKGYLAPVVIRYIGRGAGYGLFAAADMAADALIGEYAGIIRRAVPAPRLVLPFGRYPTDYAWDYPEVGEGFPPLEINALKAGNDLRFVNHSFNPSCIADHTEIDGHWVVFFRTVREIAAGTQLTVDYGEEYWSCRQRTLILFGD